MFFCQWLVTLKQHCNVDILRVNPGRNLLVWLCILASAENSFCCNEYFFCLSVNSLVNISWQCNCNAEMQKGGGTGDISLLFFLAGANFWVIFGPFWQFWVIFGPLWAILGNFLGYSGSFFGHFLVLILFGQKCNSAIFTVVKHLLTRIFTKRMEI